MTDTKAKPGAEGGPGDGFAEDEISWREEESPTLERALPEELTPSGAPTGPRAPPRPPPRPPPPTRAPPSLPPAKLSPRPLDAAPPSAGPPSLAARGSVAPPPFRPGPPRTPPPPRSLPLSRPPLATEGAAPRVRAVDVGAELRARAESLAEGDPLVHARALVELGVHAERVVGDRVAARRSFDAARARAPAMLAAQGRARRLLDRRRELPELLDAIELELRVTEGIEARADLFAERARTFAALGKLPNARAAYGEALRAAPLHAASLRGLESLLRRELGASKGDRGLWTELSGHLERMAEAYAPRADQPEGDARLAAWLLVERAEVLDQELERAEAALASLERAVELDPQPGPVRDALRHHLLRKRELPALTRALEAEALVEPDGERAARLLYAASSLSGLRLGQPAEALRLLLGALARVPRRAPIARRLLDAMIQRLEAAGSWEASAEAREQRLALVTDPAALAYEHGCLVELYATLSHHEKAAQHARDSLGLDPDQEPMRERLDELLARLGRNEERALFWRKDGGDEKRSTEARVRALCRAAALERGTLARPDEARALFEAAWVLEPGNAEAFDGLSALLSPLPPAEAPGGPRGAQARLDLYARAAEASCDPDRRIALREKMLGIWEDELQNPARALEEARRILGLDPARRSAVIAAQRSAARAGDGAALSWAVAREAELSTTPGERRRLFLRAAELGLADGGDSDAAARLVERAAEGEPSHPEVLRARHLHATRSGHHDAAREALLALIGRSQDPAVAFPLWLSVARLDEHQRRSPEGAIEAYRKAARAAPGHPLPERELVRLFGQVGDHGSLVDALAALAPGQADPADQARLFLHAADVCEFGLEDDQGALAHLACADAATGKCSNDLWLLEAQERILHRASARAELGALYARFLGRGVPAAVKPRLRFWLASCLADTNRGQAAELLSACIREPREQAAALARSERVLREAEARGPLTETLRLQAELFTSEAARRGALWEALAQDDPDNPSEALETLDRLLAVSPADAGALDSVLRLTGQPTEGALTSEGAARRSLAALEARGGLSRDRVDRALFDIEAGLVMERGAGGEGPPPEAAHEAFARALQLFPQSLLAARGLERTAGARGDVARLIVSQIALSDLVAGARAQAEHLVRAADLSAEDPAQRRAAIELHERALARDPNCLAAARSLVLLLSDDLDRLAGRLQDALAMATAPAQVTLLAHEIGRAVVRAAGAGSASPAPATGIAALRRSLAGAPGDTESRMLLARLYVASKLWMEARGELRQVLEAESDRERRARALFELTALYQGPLHDLAEAEASLRTVLAENAKNLRALEMLHQVAVLGQNRPLALEALARLAAAAPEPARRIEYLLRLAEAQREAGDNAARLASLVEALVSSPHDGRAWTMLARAFRADTEGGARDYAATLERAIDIARERQAPLDPLWLSTLGLLETTILARPAAGVAHLREAAGLRDAPLEARAALGRGLEAAGLHEEAVTLLRELLAGDGPRLVEGAEMSAALASLEAAHAKAGRLEERMLVEEVRACLGEMPLEWLAARRARRLPPQAPIAASLAGADLVRLAPPGGSTAAREVCQILAPSIARVLRFELSSLGLSSRDRVGSRDNHPTRQLADRVARCLGVEAFDLYLSSAWTAPARVFPGDPPTLVAALSLTELPEAEQAFVLGRLLARAALGTTWTDDVPTETLEALLLGALLSVEPTFRAAKAPPALAQAALALVPTLQRAISRKQRKALEELATRTGELDARALAQGARSAETRAAALICGSLLAAIDHLRRTDLDLGRSGEHPRVLLQHPVASDLLRHALLAETATARRRVGSAGS